MATLKVDKGRLPYLEDLALTLENESEFYRLYQQAATSLKARDQIYNWNSKTLKQRGADDVSMSADEREFLRRYFNAKWGLSQPGNGSRDLCDGPEFSLFQQPVKPFPQPKPATPELATDWYSLPDGTTLITADGRKYTKGPGTIDQGCHPVSISSMKEQAAKGFVIGVSHMSRGAWSRWNKEGKPCNDNGVVYDSLYDSRLVSYELPAKPTPKKSFDQLWPGGGLMSATSRDDKVDAIRHAIEVIENCHHSADHPKANQPQPQPQLKEITMNATITITTKTLINGSDIAGYSNAQLYEIIAQQEKKIAELDAIKNKPKSLKKELADRQAGINALVAHLDSRDDGDAK